jgi:transglutaminase-like putative cysteine protease
MVIPPAGFGDQLRTTYSLRMSDPGEVITSHDAFGNTILDIRIGSVERSLEFDSWVTVERSGPPGPRLLSSDWRDDPRPLDVTDRTAPDEGIHRAAEELRATGLVGLALAEAVNAWVYGRLEYLRGITGVHTTAEQALAAGGGVCQDYSHVMIAICRLLGLPALYVSGHQLGEGGTHSWVEVLLPADDGSGRLVAWAFDPTHGCRADLTYLVVAVGRDYGDVAPTAGSFSGRAGGSLSGRKEVIVTDVSYAD